MRTRGSTYHRLAASLTWAVALLHAAVVVAFLLDPSDPPRHGAIWQGLWGLSHKPAFIPLIGLLVVGPPASWLAWTTRGPHRRWLVLTWAAFTATVAAWFAHRVWVMTWLVWEHGV